MHVCGFVQAVTMEHQSWKSSPLDKKEKKKKPASPEKLIVCSGNLAKEGNLEICSVKAGSGFRGESTKPK